MSKVRLYHLARTWDVRPSDVVQALADKGKRLKSHFVEVDTSEVSEIKAILQEAGLFGRPAAPPAPAPAPEARAPEPARVEAPVAAPAAEAKPAGRDGAGKPDGATKTDKAPADRKKSARVEKVTPPAVPVAAPRTEEPARPAAPVEPAAPAAASAAEKTAPAAAPATPAVAASAAKAPEGAKPAAPAAAAKGPAPAAAARPATPTGQAPGAAGPRPTGATPGAMPRPGMTPGPTPRNPIGPLPAVPSRGGPSRGPSGPRLGDGRPGTGGPRPMGPGAPGGPRPMTAGPGQQGAPGAARPAAQGAPGPQGATPAGPPRPGPFVSADNPDFRPGRIVRRAEPAPPRPPVGAGGPPRGPGGPGTYGRGPGGPGGPGGFRGPGGPGGPGGFRGPGGPGGYNRGPGGRTDYAMPEIRARTDIPVTPNLRGDEESRRRSRFGPGGGPARGPRPGMPGVPGAPGTPGEGGGEEGVSRTSISPAKKGKQATRRSGAGGSMGTGRRLDRRMHERDRWKRASTKRKRTVKAGPVNRPTECTIDLPISVKDLSAKFAVRVADIMQILMQPPHNLMLNINAPIPREAVQALAEHFKMAVEINDEVDVDESTVKELEEAFADEKSEDLVQRQPVVAVLGHVDHGKTTLLDRIRRTKVPGGKRKAEDDPAAPFAVAPGEAGGITQHIGAYVAEHEGKAITFLDTPGHQAFTAMRARGANVTDIVLLVVAADDGVMPQTKEAIAHAKAADATIVVAMNKIDKPNANTNKVLQQLAGEGLNPVEWGGETEVIGVSALTGDGIDRLLETLVLTAEVLDLKANPNRPAKGWVLEAKKTEGRGIVASILVEEGTLRRGDTILCGLGHGRVRMMFSDRNKPVKEAGPGIPVEVIGLAEMPTAGDRFYVIEDEKKAAEIVAQRAEEKRLAEASKRAGVSADNIWEQLSKAEVNEVRIILKTDVTGSLEVLKQEIEKLSQKSSEVRLRLLHSAVGTITTSDVILAEASKPCFLIGFTTEPDGEAAALAREKAIEIRTYRIIYELLDDLEKIMSGEIAPEEKEVVLGTLVVRQTFKSSKVGTIAGCVVEKGTVRRNGKARLMRDGVVIWEGDIESLKRFKEDVKEVKEGFECGVKLKGQDEVVEGDRIEVYEIQKVARSL